MIILPDKNAPVGKVITPMRRRDWQTPSLAQPKDQLGNENQVRYRITARLNDGAIRWRGFFDDREDFDAFAWSLAKHIASGDMIPREEWNLPTPAWLPFNEEGISYELATLVFLTTTTGSNQTYTSPSDWNNSSNSIETLGAGGSGAHRINSHNTGGGGGAWNKITNFTFATPGTTTATYQLGTGGPAQSGGTHNGVAGGDTWFNNTTLAGSSVGSKGGLGGEQVTGVADGGLGGVGASGTGTSSNNGGRGGNFTNASGAGGTGGGGAAGPNGAGNQGVDSASSSSPIETAGGSGDNGSGGAAGAADGFVGGNGTEWDATHGSGGGGGGQGNGAGGNGGNYGAGGGGARDTGDTNASGAGIQGIIFLSYTPAGTATGNMIMLFN